ncbi:hypothetical protein [Streptomyces sp. KS 21]|uniref:hypothetical protein n=1 Tax=Streptomyces sp. KS 21 TaxID=2485150 RepID=UPI0010E0556A|nr:hypothetical protein [Streptomyces sp. KS 21]TDU78542.1 hypothetical protein EDD91_5332 [Streptomyces sp. KS 21]
MPVIPAPMRTARAAMFAAVCTALGAVGHSYMSGTDIPLLGLLGAFGVTGGLARLAAGRRRGPVGISAALLAVQGVLHLVFSGSQAGPGGHAGHTGKSLPLSMPEPMPGHRHLAGTALPETAAGAAGTGGTDGMAGMADMSGMAGMADMAGHGGLGMIAAHVLAGLFCAAWLAWGEAAVFRLASVLGSAALLAARPLARAVALVRARVAPAPPPPAARPSYEPPRRLRGAVPAHALVRRGPPGWRDTRATAPGRPACA